LNGTWQFSFQSEPLTTTQKMIRIAFVISGMTAPESPGWDNEATPVCFHFCKQLALSPLFYQLAQLLQIFFPIFFTRPGGMISGTLKPRRKPSNRPAIQANELSTPCLGCGQITTQCDLRNR
jgi:hypothetical protein